MMPATEPGPNGMCGQPSPSSSQDVICFMIGSSIRWAALFVAGIEFESFMVGEYCSAAYRNFRNSSAASLFLLVAETAQRRAVYGNQRAHTEPRVPIPAPLTARNDKPLPSQTAGWPDGYAELRNPKRTFNTARRSYRAA